MRAFIAIPISKDFYSRFSNVQNNFNELDLRNSSEFHLTLDFLGDISIEECDFIKSRLSNFEFKSFDLEISKIGFFPKISNPKIMWLGPSDERDIFLVEELVKKLHKHLFRRNQESPKPHITLGRFRHSPDKKKLIFLLKTFDFEIFKIPVNKLIFYESTIIDGERRHIRLCEVVSN